MRPHTPVKYSFRVSVLFACLLPLFSCNAWKYGYTWRRAENSYNLVNGYPDNFGDKRIKYNRGFRRHSELEHFLASNRLPGFIYEYITPEKCRGIRLYYPLTDSVFVFEEPAKHNIRSRFKEARKMDVYERETYDRLKQGMH